MVGFIGPELAAALAEMRMADERRIDTERRFWRARAAGGVVQQALEREFAEAIEAHRQADARWKRLFVAAGGRLTEPLVDE